MLLNMVAHLLCALTILLMEVCLITITMLYSLISKCQQNSNYKMEILLSVWQTEVLLWLANLLSMTAIVIHL